MSDATLQSNEIGLDFINQLQTICVQPKTRSVVGRDGVKRDVPAQPPVIQFDTKQLIGQLCGMGMTPENFGAITIEKNSIGEITKVYIKHDQFIPILSKSIQELSKSINTIQSEIETVMSKEMVPVKMDQIAAGTGTPAPGPVPVQVPTVPAVDGQLLKSLGECESRLNQLKKITDEYNVSSKELSASLVNAQRTELELGTTINVLRGEIGKLKDSVNENLSKSLEQIVGKIEFIFNYFQKVDAQFANDMYDFMEQQKNPPISVGAAGAGAAATMGTGSSHEIVGTSIKVDNTIVVGMVIDSNGTIISKYGQCAGAIKVSVVEQGDYKFEYSELKLKQMPVFMVLPLNQISSGLILPQIKMSTNTETEVLLYRVAGPVKGTIQGRFHVSIIFN